MANMLATAVADDHNLKNNIMDVVALLEISKANPLRATIETTVTTGFESVALDECREKFPSITEICKSRGKIFFNVDISQINEVLSMRSVDNVFVIAHAVSDIGFPSTHIDDDIAVLQKYADHIDWLKVISVWKDVVAFDGICYPTKVQHSESLEIEKVLKEESTALYETDPVYKPIDLNDQTVGLNGKLNQKNNRPRVSIDKQGELDRAKQKVIKTKIYNKLDNRIPGEKVLKYRVTCHRSGKHTFGSQDAANHFGGRLQDMFNWVVDLEIFDLEIVLNVRHSLVYTTVALTKESKHKRNINHFGPTTLRATICYNLVHLGEPKLGDVVVDPMAGGGSIPIEGVLAFPATYHIGGDMHPKATARSWANLEDLNDNKKSYMDLLAWDATKLPLKDSSVDVFVSDLPFGKRSGTKKDNRSLYREVLVELGRVVKRGHGRVVLLTQDRRSFTLALSQMQGVWKQTKTLGVNIGGLDAAVYVLKRTF